MKFCRYIVVIFSLAHISLSAEPVNKQVVNVGAGALGQVFDQALNQVKDNAAEAVLAAMSFLGVNYRYGRGSYSDGFDCSGFTKYIFDIALGIKLPRSAHEQANLDALQVIDRNNLQPGDLVFFNTMRQAFSHVGIYMGGNRFIHAPRKGSHVRIEDMGQAYWTSRFNGARRIEQDVPL